MSNMHELMSLCGDYQKASRKKYYFSVIFDLLFLFFNKIETIINVIPIM